ncbi:helix-turn-helix transcriptional regulator [Halarcobacter sp.]|uniref:helix-turn-helix transcriptional regulator n=1 Tax=Halarcobacter sp. TaxID=2321133 RepID=UPI003B008893
MSDRLLTQKELKTKFNCKDTKLYEILKLESFPLPFRLEGLATHQYSEKEIDAWIEKQKVNRISRVRLI